MLLKSDIYFAGGNRIFGQVGDADQHLTNNPYKIMLTQGEWTCTVADFRGTMTGPMAMPGGTVIQPTN